MTKKSIIEDLHDTYHVPFRREEIAAHYPAAQAAVLRTFQPNCNQKRTSSFEFTDLYNQK